MMFVIDIIERATPTQRANVLRLARQWHALRSEILQPTPLDIVEPLLQSPRSSLNPEHLDSEPAGDDGVSPPGGELR